MKKTFSIFLTILSIFLCLNINVRANEIKVIDDSDFLSAEQEVELNNLVNDYINKTGYDIVLYLTSKQEDYFMKYGSDYFITNLADDYYDYNGYGLGDERNGLILCVDMYYRDYTITTCGASCINAYTDRALNDMYGMITPYLANDDVYGASKSFINQAIKVYDNYDYYHPKPVPRNYAKEAILPALGISSVITIIFLIIFLKQLKTEDEQRQANEYLVKSNIDIYKSRDYFVNKDVSRHKIQIESNSSSFSSSGSSTHTSSSGSTHGGGGSHKF